jgi:hypothetical protein
MGESCLATDRIFPPVYLVNRRLGGPQNQCGNSEEEMCFSFAENRTTISLLFITYPNHCTDWNITAISWSSKGWTNICVWLTLQILVFALYSTSPRVQKFYILPAECTLYGFLSISEQGTIISVRKTAWLVFITETERAYCEVRTEIEIWVSSC